MQSNVLTQCGSFLQTYCIELITETLDFTGFLCSCWQPFVSLHRNLIIWELLVLWYMLTYKVKDAAINTVSWAAGGICRIFWRLGRRVLDTWMLFLWDLDDVWPGGSVPAFLEGADNVSALWCCSVGWRQEGTALLWVVLCGRGEGGWCYCSFKSTPLAKRWGRAPGSGKGNMLLLQSKGIVADCGVSAVLPNNRHTAPCKVWLVS